MVFARELLCLRAAAAAAAAAAVSGGRRAPAGRPPLPCCFRGVVLGYGLRRCCFLIDPIPLEEREPCDAYVASNFWHTFTKS